MEQQQKQKILDFIRYHTIGVIATATKDGQPEAAVVQFAETPDLHLIFNTFKTYRKYSNLQQNPHIAFVIGWEDVTVQYEGTARELSGAELETHKKTFLEKLPGAKKWDAYEETRYFVIEPTWIRYNDLRESQKEAFVVTF